MDLFLKICGAISIIGAAAALLYKGFRWLRPVRVSISYTLNFDGRSRDYMTVTVTNHCGWPVYVRDCSVRCTYPILILVLRHLRRPLLSPRLYPNLRYNGPIVYEFVGQEPIKLDPGQEVKLRREIQEHPLHALYGPMLIASVVLTSGRKMRSKRLASPPVWRMIGRRGRAPT
jgi:hypothetical protein